MGVATKHRRAAQSGAAGSCAPRRLRPRCPVPAARCCPPLFACKHQHTFQAAANAHRAHSPDLPAGSPPLWGEPQSSHDAGRTSAAARLPARTGAAPAAAGASWRGRRRRPRRGARDASGAAARAAADALVRPRGHGARRRQHRGRLCRRPAAALPRRAPRAQRPPVQVRGARWREAGAPHAAQACVRGGNTRRCERPPGRALRAQDVFVLSPEMAARARAVRRGRRRRGRCRRLLGAGRGAPRAPERPARRAAGAEACVPPAPRQCEAVCCRCAVEACNAPAPCPRAPRPRASSRSTSSPAAPRASCSRCPGPRGPRSGAC